MVRLRMSMACVRREWRVVRGARWIGWSGLMVRVWWGRVRRRRWIVCDAGVSCDRGRGELNDAPP
jgi:hypothetical protein